MIDTAIVYAADEAYAIPLAASLAGLSKASRSPRRIVVADTGLAKSSRARLPLCLPRDWTLEFATMPPAWTDGLPDPGVFSRAAYGRFFVDRLVPYAARILYLDADTLPLRDLDSLFASSLGGAVVAAVRDEYVTSFGAAEGPARLDPTLNPAAPYFNSGVLLIDALAWRRARVAERARAWLTGPGQHAELVDQDALNVALRGCWRALPAEWNVGRYWYRPERRIGRFAAITAEARILHYTTEYKPWLRPSTVPQWARTPFFTALEQTPWHDWSPPAPEDDPL